MAWRFVPTLTDPHHIFLRRAIRLAVGMPVVVVLLTVVLRLPTTTALYGVFACFSTTTMLDLGGPLARRALAYFLIWLGSLVSITIASVTSPGVWSAAIVTFVWGVLATYVGVLRGFVAAGAPMLLVPWFLTVSISGPKLLPESLLSWSIGFWIAAGFALVLWPTRLQDKFRIEIGRTIAAIADYLDCRWVKGTGLPEATTRLIEAEARLEARTRGVLIRPGGATVRERHRMQLVAVVQQLVSAVQRFPEVDAAMNRHDASLADACVAALGDAATCATAHHRHDATLPDVIALNWERERHRVLAEVGLQRDLAEGSAVAAVERVGNGEILRMVSGLCVLAASHARGSIGADPGFVGIGTLHGHPMNVVPPAETPVNALKSNLHWDSVWFQNSLRAGVAFGLAVLIMRWTGVAHGFWIALGVLSALRFDSSGSLRTIRQVAVGTTAGLVIGSLLVLVSGDAKPVMWGLLGLSAALATYTPGASTMVVGQASFTIFLIVLFGVLTPDGLGAVEARFVDVLLSLAVTLAVSLLMWPGGAADLVRDSLRESTDKAQRYLIDAYARFAEGADAPLENPTIAADAAKSYLRAAENFDLATARSVPGGVPAERWIRAANAIVEELMAAQKVSSFAALGVQTNICPQPRQLVARRAKVVAGEFAQNVAASCGLAAGAGITEELPDLGVGAVARCLEALPGGIDEDQAAEAVLLIYASRTLGNVLESSVELVRRAQTAAPTPA